MKQYIPYTIVKINYLCHMVYYMTYSMIKNIILIINAIQKTDLQVHLY